MRTPFLLRTDSYKHSHYLQYPPGTTKIVSYIESRGGRWQRVIFFGLQMFLDRYFTTPLTHQDIDEVKPFVLAHGEPFNEEGWRHIVDAHGGRLPLKIRAVQEGTPVLGHNVLVTIENTDPALPWLTSWAETMILRAVWYPTSVATLSHEVRGILTEFWAKTSDAPAEILDFKLHDFGARGVSSAESAEIGGAAHLVNFLGSDTLEGVWAAHVHYDNPMPAFSIPAAEHSTITSWGRCGELDAFRNLLERFAKPGSLVAVVSDSYDLHNAVERYWGEALKTQVLESGATVVIRPDSGDPPTVVVETLRLLDKAYGSTINARGYRVLHPQIRVIQGDGVNTDSIRAILEAMVEAGYAIDNIAFGMGGKLLQDVNRDTLRFAQKACFGIIDGEPVAIFKDPVTDPGKKSKSGYLDLVCKDGEYVTVAYPTLEAYQRMAGMSRLLTMFEDGKILNRQTLDEIRRRAKAGTPQHLAKTA